MKAAGGTAMAWGILIVSGLLEIVWALALKQAEGFTRLGPSVVGVVTAAASLYLLANALSSEKGLAAKWTVELAVEAKVSAVTPSPPSWFSEGACVARRGAPRTCLSARKARGFVLGARAGTHTAEPHHDPTSPPSAAWPAPALASRRRGRS